jgi:hypothetical protein
MLDIESSEDLEDWNMRLPVSKLDLVGKAGVQITCNFVTD